MAEQRLVMVTPDLLVGNYAAPSNGGHLGDQDISDDRTPSEPASTVALEPKGTAPAPTHREATIFTDSSEYPFYETQYGPLSPRYWFTEFNGERTRMADTQSPLLRRKPSSTSGGLLQRCSLYWKQMLPTIQPRHCTDLLRAGQQSSGVYNIFHKAAGPRGQSVYCDMETDGGGWTVIQRRGQFGNSVYHFYRNWAEYADGFGNASEEYWVGNKALHALTSDGEEMTLRVVLSNKTGETAFVDYESIRVGNEEELFKMQLGKLLGPEGWDALGNANGQNFSTFDRDNDMAPGEHCAVRYRGGWWYNRCHLANLNGLNLNGPHESFADGIEWSVRGYPVRLYHYSFPSAHMMIRPAGSLLDRRSKLVAPLPA
ncbi:hypothetical protein HPB50_014822 [Hyalomma asiaticum]|uniref:Uncharacterized protein n=1 Tax=Hyalomma asiaticum TaxID=266040 RepID=A0ACB7SI64_HYAAI|nr:hypothetical protein HPB50_014822 [Hyalomma asiaticum]